MRCTNRRCLALLFDANLGDGLFFYPAAYLRDAYCFHVGESIVACFRLARGKRGEFRRVKRQLNNVAARARRKTCRDRDEWYKTLVNLLRREIACVTPAQRFSLSAFAVLRKKSFVRPSLQVARENEENHASFTFKYDDDDARNQILPRRRN